MRAAKEFPRKHSLGSFVSAVATLGLLAGVPVLLLGLHLPPPVQAVMRAVTHPRAWDHALRSSLGDGAVVVVVSLIAWVAWFWLAVCLVTELLASLRGVPTVHLPGSRYGQSLAACLVGACIALLPTTRFTPQLRLQAVEFSVARPSLADQAEEFLATMTLSPEPGAETVDSDLPPTYVVQPGDTLWSIAERELGSPLRWRQLAELNMGRLQPDGRELTDAHWIFPGWVLVLPTPAPPAPAAPQPAPPAPAAQATASLPAPAHPVAPADAPFSSLNSPVRGFRSYPLSTEISLARESLTGAAQRTELRGNSVPVAPIGYGILGAVVIGVLDRMRRAQQRHRRTGLRIALPDADMAELERGLRLGADPEAAAWIDLGQRLLSSRSRMVSGAPAPPRFVAARLRADSLELMLDAAHAECEPIAPFETGSDGTSWLLPRQRAILDRMQESSDVAGAQAPLPSLVTLGHDELGVVLLDLEHAGSLMVSGKEAEQVVQAMAIELACSKWSDQVELVTIGLEAHVEALERASRAPSVAHVLQRFERRVQERKALLDIVRRATNYETRWIEGGDAWDLNVVFCMEVATRAEPEAVNELIGLAGDGSYGLAVVVCTLGHDDLAEVRVQVRADGGPLTFERGASDFAHLSRNALWPQHVERDFAKDVASLVEVAARTEGVPPSSPPYKENEESSAASGPPVEVSEVEVRILGPVEIVGAARELTRAWAAELVVYLSVHRNGASTEMWSTALWPDRVMAPATLHSTASAARRALGVSQSGEDHLPRSHGRLALGAGVTTDWERFRRYSRSSQPEDWRRALTLVRGRPFEGLRAPDWALLEGITATVEAEVVDLSCRFAERCLAEGDSSGAQWAARQGLRVSAFDERLYRILMRAADSAGNPAGVETIMAELARLVNDEVEPFDAVHPETLELYRRLSRRPLASRSR